MFYVILNQGQIEKTQENFRGEEMNKTQKESGEQCNTDLLSRLYTHHTKAVYRIALYLLGNMKVLMTALKQESHFEHASGFGFLHLLS